MGKKSKRNKNKNNGGPPRKGLPNIYDTICRWTDAKQYDEILKVESKLRHLDSFSDDPSKDAYVLYAFGSAICDRSAKDKICFDRAIDYFERAKERVEDSDSLSVYQQEAKKSFKARIDVRLALLYSDAGRDMEKAISSHRGFLENRNRDEVTAVYVIHLSENFNRFEKFEYAIEVLEGFMDMMETVREKVGVETNLINAYIGCGEFLKAKAAHKKCRSFDMNRWVAEFQAGCIEEGLCNYEAAIIHYREVIAELQKEEYDDMSRLCSSFIARILLKHSADNEAEAFAIFQKKLDLCVDPLRREKILIEMGTEYRKLNKWDQSIETFRQLCQPSTRPESTMLHEANEGMAQTYLEQYCTDTTLTIDQRTQLLCHATDHYNQVDEISTKRHLTQAQLFYFNGDKLQAYRHLELYLDDRLADCKLTCYTCQQRVRRGSVPFSCASCKVASYCGRKHQKMTWKNERVCHKVLCPLLGYWRMAKKKQKKQKRLTNVDRHECGRVFDTFFESICPHMKLCGGIPSYTMID